MVRMRLAAAVKVRPSKVFIMMGANDIVCGLPNEILVEDYAAVLDSLLRGCPDVRLYCHSLLPSRGGAWGVDNSDIRRVNGKLRELVEDRGCRWVDIHDLFLDGEGEMREEYTDDGVHLSPEGYMVWEKAIFELVRG